MRRLNDAERQREFGAPGVHLARRVVTPWGLPVLVHEEVAPRFMYACTLAFVYAGGWRPARIDSFNKRPIAGTSEWSLHAYALAWDFFATPPGVAPPGGVRTPENGVPEAFGRQFERYGFTWGARWGNRDVPHLEWAAGRPRALVHGGIIGE